MRCAYLWLSEREKQKKNSLGIFILWEILFRTHECHVLCYGFHFISFCDCYFYFSSMEQICHWKCSKQFKPIAKSRSCSRCELFFLSSIYMTIIVAGKSLLFIWKYVWIKDGGKSENGGEEWCVCAEVWVAVFQKFCSHTLTHCVCPFFCVMFYFCLATTFPF